MGTEKILAGLQKIIRQSPADQTEAVLLTEDSSLTRFTPDSIHQHVAERNETLVLRVVLGKRIAVLTTNILASAPMKASLQKAVSLARLLPPTEDFVSLPRPKPIPQIHTYLDSIRRLTPARKVKTVRMVMGLAGEKGCRASGAFSHGETEVSVVNSEGVEASQKYSDVFFHLVAENGGGSGYASFVSRDAERLEVERLVHSALSKIRNGVPAAVEPGEYEVILEPDAVHELLLFLGYLGFNALAVQEGRSFMGGQFGKRIVGREGDHLRRRARSGRVVRPV